MLFQELGKLKRSMIMTSVIMMAAGILMLICPERYGRMLVAAAGYGLLILAAVMGFEFLSSKRVLINYVYLTVSLLIGTMSSGCWGFCSGSFWCWKVSMSCSTPGSTPGAPNAADGGS